LNRWDKVPRSAWTKSWQRKNKDFFLFKTKYKHFQNSKKILKKEESGGIAKW
jgi:hypothetical protein